MLQGTNQNDTLLRQLHQAVEIRSSNTLKLQPKLIQPDTSINFDTVRQAGNTQQAISNQPEASTHKTARTQTEQSIKLDNLKPISPTKVETHTELPRPGIVLPEKSLLRDKPDWIIGVYILLLILLASVRLFFNKYLNQLFHSIVNYPTSSRLFRDRSVSITHAAFRLDLMFYLIFSVFIYQFFNLFHVSFGQTSLITYLIILGMVVGYYLLKRLIYSIVGVISDSTQETSEYLYNMHLHNRVLGLSLLPISLVIAFASLQNPRTVVYIGLLVCGIFYFLLLIRGAKILITKHFSIFYLILYLCTLEILPLIFIYSMVLVKNGIK